MPTTSASMVSSGRTSTSAMTRGKTRKWIGIEPERAQRVDLLRDLHRAELGGERRARAAGDDDRGHQRAELARDRQRRRGRRRRCWRRTASAGRAAWKAVTRPTRKLISSTIGRPSAPARSISRGTSRQLTERGARTACGRRHARRRRRSRARCSRRTSSASRGRSGRGCRSAAAAPAGSAAAGARRRGRASPARRPCAPTISAAAALLQHLRLAARAAAPSRRRRAPPPRTDRSARSAGARVSRPRTSDHDSYRSRKLSRPEKRNSVCSGS